jgi:hypothetical protein
MLTCNRLEAGGSKLEAWLTVADFFLSFEPQASCLKLISALADGLMLVFQQPVRGFLPAKPGNTSVITIAYK